MTPTKTVALAIGVLLLCIGMLSIFIVNEGESALILRLGNLFPSITDKDGKAMPKDMISIFINKQILKNKKVT